MTYMVAQRYVVASIAVRKVPIPRLKSYARVSRY